MDDLCYEYPEETAEGFSNPQAALEHLAWDGIAKRYPQGVPAEVTAILTRELEIVGRLKYAPYFLTVADIVRFARSGRDRNGNPIDPSR
jgi:error-prone DNA polymerase